MEWTRSDAPLIGPLDCPHRLLSRCNPSGVGCRLQGNESRTQSGRGGTAPRRRWKRPGGARVAPGDRARQAVVGPHRVGQARGVRHGAAPDGGRAAAGGGRRAGRGAVRRAGGGARLRGDAGGAGSVLCRPRHDDNAQSNKGVQAMGHSARVFAAWGSVGLWPAPEAWALGGIRHRPNL
jgi:hypothetical protein